MDACLALRFDLDCCLFFFFPSIFVPVGCFFSWFLNLFYTIFVMYITVAVDVQRSERCCINNCHLKATVGTYHAMQRDFCSVFRRKDNTDASSELNTGHL